jgi:hypothetical protein
LEGDPREFFSLGGPHHRTAEAFELVLAIPQSLNAGMDPLHVWMVDLNRVGAVAAERQAMLNVNFLLGLPRLLHSQRKF